jgi:hypothetical protein
MPTLVRRVARRILPDHLVDRLRGVSASMAAKTWGSDRPTAIDDAAAASSVVPVDTSVGEAQQIVSSLRGASTAEVATAIRSLLDDHKPYVALAVAAALEGADADLAAGIVAGARGFEDRTWSLLKDLPAEVWSTLAPDEYVRAGLLCAREDAVAALWSLAKEGPATVPAKSWLALLGPAYAYGEYDLAKALFERLDTAVGDGSGIEGDVRWPRDWLREWVDRPGNAPTIERAPGTTASFAILDYRHPDRFRASANIGDHVQSLAAVSHVVRHHSLRFEGPDGLVDLATRLQQRVRPEIRRDDREGTVELYLAQRDASNHDAFPPDTWAIGFGWYMHPQFGINHDFPFHPNLRPIFVSFHVNTRQMITPEAVEYLKKYGPVGCRDWTTVDLLLSAGVDAFFSGCMTTTVSNLFPDTDVRPPSDAPTVYIDVPDHKVPAGGKVEGQARDAVRLTPFAGNLDFAVAMLETYRRKYAAITTSRLHVYLPGRSIGVPINFNPENMSDPRFAGLAPIDDAAFDAIRDGINSKLEQVLGAALSGAPVDEVYELWRRITAEDVAAAKSRLWKRVEIAHPVSRLAEAVTASASAPPAGLAEDVIHVAIRATSSHPRLLRVLLSSVAEHTSRPVHARIITRSPRSFDVDQIERAAPGVRVSIVDSTGLGSDLIKADGNRFSGAEADRFATVDLLPGVDRLIVLPVGSVVTGDLAELADLDLDGRLVAAPRQRGSRARSGYAVLLGAARRLRDKTARSAEFRRVMHQRHSFDFGRFDTELLVVDASAWRQRRMLPTFVSWAENFGLTYREALHAELGPDHASVPDRWCVVPSQTGETEVALVYWAEQPWPWGKSPAPLRDLWQAANARMLLRNHAPVS